MMRSYVDIETIRDIESKRADKSLRPDNSENIIIALNHILSVKAFWKGMPSLNGEPQIPPLDDAGLKNRIRAYLDDKEDNTKIEEDMPQVQTLEFDILDDVDDRNPTNNIRSLIDFLSRNPSVVQK